jgi:CRISPR/Cas system CMR subunit Cmr6 (Cas7 group RAMP superfamily)
LSGKKSYSGKVVKIKGKVTKFNPAIMEKNWVHIQDGTDFRNEFDITVTTNVFVTVGDTITFEGKIALDQDFGYGYVYKVLMEDGKPVF